MTRFLRKVLLSSAVLLLPAAVAEPITLKDAISLALNHDPSIDQAMAQIDQSDAAIASAIAQTRPTAGVQAEVGVLDTDFTQDHITQTPRSVGLQAEWTVFSSGRLSAAQEAASFQRSAAGFGLGKAREQTVLSTVEAYAQSWLARQVEEVAVARRDNLQTRLDETNANFNEGVVTRTDVALTEARLASAEADLATAQAGRASADARLARLTGLPDPEPVEAVSVGGSDIMNRDTTLARVIDNNPDLAAVSASLQSADAKLRETEAQFGPKVSVRARATYGEEMFFFFDDPIQDVGAFVTFEMPLYTGGMKEAASKTALAGKAGLAAQRRQMELELEQNVTSLYSEISARRLALVAATRAETAAELAAEGAKKEYEAGLRTLVDSLDAETEFRNAQISRLRAQTALAILEARLLSLSQDLEASLAE